VQQNGYDCGVFVIRFAEMILQKWPSSTEDDIKDGFRSQFATEFSQEDISEERIKIRSLLEK
jgi:Ulp1 family protease